MKNLTSRASKEKKKIENNVRRMKKVQDDAEVAATSALSIRPRGHFDNIPDLESEDRRLSRMDAFVKDKTCSVSRIADVDDLFNNNFYTHKGHEILILIQKTLSSSGPEDINTLSKSSRILSVKAIYSHIFKVTGADVRYAIISLCPLFRNRDNHIQTEDLLFPRNQNGF
ncbi:DNA-binding transcription factor rap1 [Clavispora lusitaniae]|nr:DNA-binding transcription factor rap1 [Clavispora lusitaniae]